MDFQELSPNKIFFDSITLVCGGDGINWLYSQYNPDFVGVHEPATYEDTQHGLSWLAISVSKQGFYGCNVFGQYYREIGVFDPSLTTGEFLHLFKILCKTRILT